MTPGGTLCPTCGALSGVGCMREDCGLMVITLHKGDPGYLENPPVMVTVPKEQFERLKADARELAEDVIAHAEIEWSARAHYPHQQRKYDRDTETARRVLARSSGSDRGDG